MTILKCGFDKTRFENAAIWQEILDACGLTYRGELSDEKGFEWRCDNKLLVVTGDNPVTGKSRIKTMAHECVPGWAGYIGVEGLAEDVLDFVSGVFMRADIVKNFDSRNRSYI